MERSARGGPDDGGRIRPILAHAAGATAGQIVSVGALFDQARRQFRDLERAFASQRHGRGGVEMQLSELACTVARLGTTAERLEQQMVRMRHVAHHDPLTGLPNRTLLLDRLDRALAQAMRNGGQVALLMMDLDAFKVVNDRFGHGAGDRLLQEVAQRLRATIRDADTICRYGGDEFVVLLPDTGRRGAADVACKIHERLAAPFLVEGSPITVGACIGIAVCPADGASPVALLERADTAMYACKGDAVRRHVASATGVPRSVRYRLLGETRRVPGAGATRSLTLIRRPQ